MARQAGDVGCNDIVKEEMKELIDGLREMLTQEVKRTDKIIYRMER